MGARPKVVQPCFPNGTDLVVRGCKVRYGSDRVGQACGVPVAVVRVQTVRAWVGGVRVEGVSLG